MANQRIWKVYDCDIIDLAEANPEAEGLPRAIAIHGERPLAAAEALPKGFVTKVLLDYDFSDDDQVLAFVRRYGPVTCPYGGAIFRTTMALEDPQYYPQKLSQVAFIRGRDGGRGGLEEADLLCRSGLSSSQESAYLLTEARGFARYLADDDRLVATERLRALACGAEALRGQGASSHLPCYVSVEEARGVLYLLQAASVVLQGYSYSDATWRMPGEAGDDAGDDAVATERRVERLFQLFIMGRPNVVKALYSLDATCLEDRAEGDDFSDVLDESERQRVSRVLGMARQAHAADPKVLRLLALRPAWRVWGRLREDLAIFVEACLTNGWTPRDHHLIEDESLMVGDRVDGGPFFEDRANRMTLQKAIAEQIRHQLDIANQSCSPNRRANASNEPVWHVCSECGRLFMFRSTTDRLVMKGESKPGRDRIPSAETCSNMCRQRKSRAGKKAEANRC